MSKWKSRDYAAAMLGIFGVPAVAVLLAVNDSNWPHLPGQAKTWNTQYLLHFTAALLVGFTAWNLSRNMSKPWRVGVLSWNLLHAALFLLATYMLWGEKL